MPPSEQACAEHSEPAPGNVETREVSAPRIHWNKGGLRACGACNGSSVVDKSIVTCPICLIYVHGIRADEDATKLCAAIDSAVMEHQRKARKPTVEQILEIWSKQPGAVVSAAERQFIVDMRKAAEAHVGYGWMIQVIQWEWSHKESTGSI